MFEWYYNLDCVVLVSGKECARESMIIEPKIGSSSTWAWFFFEKKKILEEKKFSPAGAGTSFCPKTPKSAIKKFCRPPSSPKELRSSLSEVTAKTFRSHYTVPPSVPEEEMASKIKMYDNSIFMAGRYNKFSRELPQTPWIVDGNRIMETSVEELITEPLKQIIKIDGTSIRAQDLIHFWSWLISILGAKFASSGREDVDVRMLGNGRPFLLEVLNPWKAKFSSEEWRGFEEAINSKSEDVFVRDLQVVPK